MSTLLFLLIGSLKYDLRHIRLRSFVVNGCEIITIIQIKNKLLLLLLLYLIIFIKKSLNLFHVTRCSVFRVLSRPVSDVFVEYPV